jgi:adenosine deaminase
LTLRDYITAVPKVDLHVHLEGSMPPETLLRLARKHGIALPVNTLDEVRDWFTFIDMPHFVNIYISISRVLQTPEDIEQLARDFLKGQAAQNIVYSEVTYTPYTHYHQKGIPFHEQLDALNRARRWAEDTLGVTMRYIFDIARELTPAEGAITADWVIDAFHEPDSGIVALGLGGYEVGHPPGKFSDSFARARDAGVTLVLHAGEHGGSVNIHGALAEGSVRIGHGIGCIDDAPLVALLRERQVPLEVCPTSNVCLGGSATLAAHPIQRMIDAGLNVTVNSDDPPMFNTTLTEEFIRCAETFGWSAHQVDRLIMNAARSVLLPPDAQAALEAHISGGMVDARVKYL